MRVKVLPGVHGRVQRVITGTEFNQQVLLEIVHQIDGVAVPTGEIVTRHIKLRDGLWYMAVNHWTDPMEIGQVTR